MYRTWSFLILFYENEYQWSILKKNKSYKIEKEYFSYIYKMNLHMFLCQNARKCMQKNLPVWKPVWEDQSPSEKYGMYEASFPIHTE